MKVWRWRLLACLEVSVLMFAAWTVLVHGADAQRVMGLKEDGHMATEAMLLAKLKVIAQNGQLDGVQIEYWVGGGQPPPYYRSEQFRVLSRGGTTEMEFAVLHFVSSLSPNEVTEKFTASADPESVRSLASMLVDAKVFEMPPTETGPSIGDAISHEIIVSMDKLELKRTYVRAVPPNLAPFDALCQKLISRLKDEGRHTWTHQGRAISDPFNPKR